MAGVTLHVLWGRSIGLVGASGAGKSTLVDLILGLRHPDQGRILADGRDIGDDIAAWQRRIGYVPQQIALIDDTIRRNIALGIPPREIDAARIDEVIGLAHLDALIAELPQGLETIVGEEGARLSGGQRQRIGIARALYHDPDLLVLDEATSALDNETESKIAQMLGELAGIKTMIVVAHRLSTVRRCDNIAILRDGVCVGQGPYNELASSNIDFANLVRAGST